MVGDQSLVTLDDPGEVADAGRLAGLKGERHRQPGWVGESLRPGGPQLKVFTARQSLAEALCLGQVEAEEIAGVGIAGQAGILQTSVLTYE